MDYDLIVVKTLERVYKNYYYIIRGDYMSKKKGTGVSPITNRIYYGTQDTEKHMWIGQKTDITDSAIASVFEWFMANMEGKQEYSITYPETDFELVMRRKAKND